MSLKEPDPIPLLPGEQEAGFSVLTLVYPEIYELPLEGKSKARYERAVALLVDDESRFRRTRDGRYLHEIFKDGAWTKQTDYETLASLKDSAIFQKHGPL